MTNGGCCQQDSRPCLRQGHGQTACPGVQGLCARVSVGAVMGRDGCLVTKNLEGAHLAEIQTRNLRGCLPRVAGGSPSHHEVSGPAFSTQGTGA